MVVAHVTIIPFAATYDVTIYFNSGEAKQE